MIYSMPYSSSNSDTVANLNLGETEWFYSMFFQYRNLLRVLQIIQNMPYWSNNANTVANLNLGEFEWLYSIFHDTSEQDLQQARR